MFNDVVDSLAQRRRFLDWSAENVSSSSDNCSKCCLLLGKPGTGKSQIVIQAIHYTISQEFKVLLVAPVVLLAQD